MPENSPKISKISFLKDFERRVADEFEMGKIRCPVHLSGGNEEQLISIFDKVHPRDWVFSTWRWHYHALLHKIAPQDVMDMIKSSGMNAFFPSRNFYSSAIVGGILPIATGVAWALKRKKSERKVWCFIGDMASYGGMFQECQLYATGHDLPITFVIEDNGYSTNAPTEEVWGRLFEPKIKSYEYTRIYPHMGVGKWVNF